MILETNIKKYFRLAAFPAQRFISFRNERLYLSDLARAVFFSCPSGFLQMAMSFAGDARLVLLLCGGCFLTVWARQKLCSKLV